MANEVQTTDADELAFQTKLLLAVDQAIDRRMAFKNEGEFFTYQDAHEVCAEVRLFFTQLLDFVPPEIEGSCLIGEALMSPSFHQRLELWKKAVSVLGPISGAAMIIAGVGMVLGWGSGLIATITAFFAGISWTGPVILIFAGLGIAVVATRYARTDDKSTYAAKFREVMRKSLSESIHLIWKKHGNQLRIK